MDIQKIIEVKQLPEIVEQLEKVSSVVKKSVSKALSMDCNADTVKEVKKVRSGLNKEFEELEDRRKFVKKQILSKYEEFEEVYKEKISAIYGDADKELKDKIEAVENELKKQKEDQIREFVEEYIKSKHLEDILDYDKFDIKITLTNSMKSIKDGITKFVDRIENEVKLIGLEEYKEEIMVEYKKTLDLAYSKLAVVERHKEIEKIKEQESVIQKVKEREQQAVQMVVEEIKTPVEVVEEEEPIFSVLEEQESEMELTVSFEVTATKEKLKQLKQFLVEGGYKYE